MRAVSQISARVETLVDPHERNLKKANKSI